MRGFKFRFLSTTLFILLKLLPLAAVSQLSCKVDAKTKSVAITSINKQYNFTGQFSILYSANDPELSLRSAGIKGVLYNVPTWKATDA